MTCLGKFNILWAVGLALGVSRKVDLKFTRKHKIARIKVGCLDPDLIPEFLSMLIGEHVYDLQFRAEKNMDPENPVPINMDLDPPRENGNDSPQNNHELPDNDFNNGRDVVDSGPKLVGKGNSASHGKKCAQEPTAKDQQGQAADNNQFVSSHISKDKVGKPVTPLRSSKRTASVADQNSLERASKLKAKINLDGSPNEGNNPTYSDVISALSTSVGISLGSSLNSVVEAINSSHTGEGLESERDDQASFGSESDNDWEANLLSVNLPIESDDDCTIEELQSSDRDSSRHNINNLS